MANELNKNVLTICITIILVSVLISGVILFNKFGSVNLIEDSVKSNNNQVAQQPQQQNNNQPAAPVNVSADDDPFIGNENAPVTVIEFSDFQCPICRKLWKDALPSIKKEYVDAGKVKFVYRDFPLSFHPGAMPAALAAECAKEQGKFWQMHDKIFEEQDKQGSGTVQFTIDDLKKWAAGIGLNASKFNQCLDSEKYKKEVEKDIADGSAAGVRGTPATFVNGKLVSGAQPFSAFKSAIDAELNK